MRTEDDRVGKGALDSGKLAGPYPAPLPTLRVFAMPRDDADGARAAAPGTQDQSVFWLAR